MPSTPPIKVPILGIDKYSKEFKNMTKRAQDMGRTIQGVGRGMSRMVTLPLVAAGVASGKFARDLNESMANVGTLIPGQIERLRNMKSAVMDLAVDTGIAQTDISEGLYETISAFGDLDNPINKLELLSKAARAGRSTVVEALGLVSAVTKGYGDTSDEAAQKVADMSFLTVKLGQTNFPDLAAAMGQVVPLATTLKVKQEQLFGSMSTLTGVTGNASEVSTQLASALGAIIKPSSDMTKTAKKLGYESAVAMIKEIGFAKTIEELGRVTGGSEEKLGKLFTRKEGLNAVLTLLGPQAENFAKKTAAMGKAAGATDEAFKEQTKGINEAGFEMDQGIQRAKKAGVIIGDRLLPVVAKLTEKLIPLADRISKLSDAQLDWGIKIAVGAAALGPLLIGVGKMIALYPSFRLFFSGGAGLIKKLTTQMIAASTQTVALGTAQDGLSTKIAFTNAKLGTSIKKFGALKTAGAVFASFVVGWEVGTVIRKTLVDPLMEAVNLSRKAHDILKGIKAAGGVKSFTTKSLEQQANTLRAGIQAEREALASLNQAAMSRGGPMVETTQKLQDLVKALGDVEGQISENKTVAKAREAGFEDLGEQRSFFGGQGDAFQFDAALLAAMEQSRESEAKVTISFEGLPDSVTPKVTQKKGGKTGVRKSGAVMAGAL